MWLPSIMSSNDNKVDVFAVSLGLFRYGSKLQLAREFLVEK